ncbi:antifungal protein precursor [Penicillium soppii]|uniref:antifungal protein precursor n=1 Tax=Penicillium soppii TaxID=69789 RepID=UPI0025478051|nr:antifungal protein precursor [Penicillium soppii]KAJ5882575.1 antifungal protein precursor [Penicillium soppii]
MQITNLALCFFVAMGAVASPIDTASGGLEARDEAAALRDFPGKCVRSNNTCKYKDDRNKTVIRKCNTKFANQRCTKDGNPCTVDTYGGVVKCS